MATGVIGVFVVMDRWNAMSASARRGVVAGLLVLTLVVVIGGINALGASPGGPTLSSYATDGEGLAAYEELLATAGHPTSQLRSPLDKKAQPTDATLVAIGQTFSRAEGRALARFLTAGGTAIVGDFEAEDALRAIHVDGLHWRGHGAASAAPAAGADLGDVRHIRGQGFGAWSGPARPLLHNGELVIAISVPVGAGELIALADPSPVTNAWIGIADNAGFAVAIAGPSSRPVIFAEYGHGFGVRNGLGAIPARWKAALWFAGIAGVVGALSAAKRFGPPEPEAAIATPARVLFVESLASTLARTRDHEAAMAPLKERAKSAIVVGLSADEAAALASPITSDLDVLALGRVVAKLEET